MKIIKEYIIKVIIIIFFFVFSLEICVCVFIYRNSKSIYKKLFDDTLEKSGAKAHESMRTINKFISNLLMTYITKLKLISKHLLLYNGKSDSNNENIINKNSKLFKNKNIYEKILEAKTDVINEKNFFKDIFNKTSEKFDYIEYYMRKYGNETDNRILLNKLLKEHAELNYISYHNISGEEFDLSYLDEEELKKINFLIPIFKSIYLERLLIKRDKMDISRIFLMTSNELLIYPPEDAYKINLYNTKDMMLSSCSSEINYYSCIYDYLGIDLFYLDYYMTIIPEFDDMYNLIYSICIKFNYYKDSIYDSILCMDVNFGPLINSINFPKTKNFDFGVAKTIIVDELEYPIDFFVIYNNNRKLNEVLQVFNNTEYAPEGYIFREDKYNYYSLFHSFYLDMAKILKEHPELNVNISAIDKEYEDFKINFLNQFVYGRESDDIFEFEVDFNKTTCRKKLISNEYECFLCEFRMSMIMPFIFTMNDINEDVVDTNVTREKLYELFTYSIAYTCPQKNANDFEILIKIKLIRTVSLYMFLMIIIFINYILFIKFVSNFSLYSINDLTKKINNIKINEKTRKITLLKNDNKYHENKEMMILNSIYKLINNSSIIEEIFENEALLKNHELNLDTLLDSIKNKNVKEICNSLFGIFHFNNNKFNLAESEIKLVINFLKQNEQKLKIEGKDEFDKIKEAIKRTSMVPYLNEYSEFNNVDENMIDTIYLNIFKQRFIYLYAMIKYKLAIGINNEQRNNIFDDDKIKRKKEKRKKYLNEAIKYFQECKSINKLLGINQIKIIYSLIMISKCYLNLNDYKNSINNINAALNLYFDFSKIFKEYHSSTYNPKVMLFVETNIFQYILFTLSNICSTFRKPNATIWITFKIFNTSPFILNNVHYTGALILKNLLDKYKNKIKQLNKKNPTQNRSLIIQLEKTQKNLIKTISRLYEKTLVDKNTNEINIKTGEDFMTKSINKTTLDKTSKLSSNLNTSKYKSIYFTKIKRLKKNITLCLNENILDKIDWMEFRDVMIKYLLKYFRGNPNDNFGYIQYDVNGLKTKLFLSKTLKEFILRLSGVKNNSKLIDNSIKNKSETFLGLSNIFEPILNNYQEFEQRDNIIFLFIDSKDIKFSSVIDCVNTVDEFNQNNTSLFIFSFDEKIGEKKVEDIQSFLAGLIEGYFFQFQNYRQLREIFVNLSTNKYQTNYFRYSYESFDNFFC